MNCLVRILSTCDLDLCDEDSTRKDIVEGGGSGFEGFETENEVENHNATAAEACEATQNLDFFLQEANDNLSGLVTQLILFCSLFYYSTDFILPSFQGDILAFRIVL